MKGKVFCQAAALFLLLALTSAPANAQFGFGGGGGGEDMMTQMAPMLEMMKAKMGKRRFAKMMQTMGPMMEGGGGRHDGRHGRHGRHDSRRLWRRRHDGHARRHGRRRMPDMMSMMGPMMKAWPILAAISISGSISVSLYFAAARIGRLRAED